ncbi:hypothetical protein G6F59_016848 [Rhizopus arrhizus]|nr:hypothetical protein G6F59_016848 [Rhizopus arrhizus]
MWRHSSSGSGDLAAHQPHHPRDLGNGDGDQHGRDAGAGARDQGNRQQDAGNRHDGVHRAHDEPVQRSEPAGDHTDDQSDGDADDGGAQARDQRDAGAVGHARPDVAAEGVRAKQIVGEGLLEPGARVDEGGVHRAQERGEQCDGDDGDQHHQRQHDRPAL